jgi:hypothetical protein
LLNDLSVQYGVVVDMKVVRLSLVETFCFHWLSVKYRNCRFEAENFISSVLR